MEVGDILAVLAQSKDLVSVSDLGLDIVFVSEGARTILGYEPEAVLGKNGLEFFHPDDVGLFAAVVGQMTTDGYQPVAPTLYRLRHADGSFVTLELLGGGVEKAGIPLGFWMIGRQPRRSDVYATVLHALLDEQPLAVALEPVASSMFPEIASKVCITCWPPSEAMFSVGERLPPSLTGRHRSPGSPWDRAVRTGAVVACASRDELDPETAELAAQEKLASLLVMPLQVIGSEVTGLLTVWGMEGNPMAAGLRGLGDLVCDLVTAALSIRERFDDLHRTARSDSLTGLANRKAFDEALTVNAHDSSVAILYIDLDRFKAVNDSYGHLVGDALLEVVARRMAREIRSQDLIARLGGDEFAVLCPGCERDEASGIAQRIIDAVSEPIMIGESRILIGASVGVAHAPVYAEDLLRRADDALYNAKSHGRGQFQFSED